MLKMFNKFSLAALFISFSWIISIEVACFNNSAKADESKLIGLWRAEYKDSTGGAHTRYLNFKSDQKGKAIATMDEPDEDWYDIPFQKLVINDNRINLELWWGLEKFDGTVNNDYSIIKGNRIVYNENGQKPIVYRRIDSNAPLAFRIPRIDKSRKIKKEYKYTIPSDNIDGFATGNLPDLAPDSAKINNMMNRILTSSIPNIHSILIMKDGKLVLEEYFYGYDKSRTHRIHAVTASFTSALIGIAWDKGLIKDLNSPVYEYFQDHSDSPWVADKYNITIKHLLSMTAGLERGSLAANSTPDIIELYKSKSCLEFLLNKKQHEQPGVHFSNNDGLSVLLGIVLNKASGMSVLNFAEENLFKPLDIKKYSWDVRVDGTAGTEGGLKMRPRDMLKFGLLFLNNGQCKGRRIVSEKWIAESTSNHTPIGEQPYGYQWWIGKFVINHRVVESYYARGFGDQFIFIVPELDLVVAFTAGNFFQQNRRPLEMMAEYILPAFLTQKDIPADQPISAEDINLLKGDYTNNNNEIFKITNEGNKLFVTPPGEQQQIEVFKINDKHYYVKNPPVDAILSEDENGKLSRIEIYRNGQRTEEIRKQ